MGSYEKSAMRDGLEDNYLALCVAILYPYGIGCEEAKMALDGKLREPVVAAGILKDASEILKNKKKPLERLRAVLDEDAYERMFFVQEMLLFYDRHVGTGDRETLACVKCRYSGTGSCWREFVRFMGIPEAKKVKSCKFAAPLFWR